MKFINEHADRTDGGLRWGVESICAVLSEHGVSIAPSTYYAARSRSVSRRELRDRWLRGEIERVHRDNYRVYGARKVWLQLNRDGIPVGRARVERLMRELGLSGVRRGKSVRTTQPDATAERADDLVQRRFDPPRPDRLWVADFCYVPTRAAMVYVAFVVDAYARRILGWKAATRMRTELVLDALEHAVWTRRRQGVAQLSGLIHHNDAGSQYTAITFTSRLAEVGVLPSIGSVGDAYDNALCESVIGMYKTELIKLHGPWAGLEQVEAATLDYVDWFNHHRLYEVNGDIPPVELEQAYYRQLGPSPRGSDPTN